jgi:hypothetical protein
MRAAAATMSASSRRPESSAEEMVVRFHFLERQARGLRRIFLNARDNLTTRPHLATIRRDVDCAVERFHRCMRQERQLVFAIDPFALSQALGDIADRFCDHAVLLAGGAQIVPNVG